MQSHQFYLQRALALANVRRGFCAPNPAVGAVLVKDGHIIGEGYHFAPGYPHAEVNAIADAGLAATDATLYVTLEPCSHTGRTPPCVDAILQAKIKTVYFGFLDPNPLVSGQGQKRLRQAGVHCEHLASAEIAAFYRSYHYWALHQKPWITVKIALSANQKIANPNNQPAQITAAAATTFTHEKRKRADAILTTATTILCDDPQLNARIGERVFPKPIYILDRQCQIPKEARIQRTAKSITRFYQQGTACTPVRAIAVPAANQALDLHEVIRHIGQDGIHDLWVEVGNQAFHSLVTQKLANEIYLYESPITLPDTASAFTTPLTEILQNYQELPSEYLGPDYKRHFLLV